MMFMKDVLIDERGVVMVIGSVVFCCSTRQDSFHASKLQGQSMFKVRHFSIYCLPIIIIIIIIIIYY